MNHPQMTKNVDLSSFCVVKHGWKGNYKRLLTFGTMGLTTYNCETLRVTNQWLYGEICGIDPDVKNLRSGRFTLWVREVGNKKKKEMKFSSDFRTIILTEALRYSHMFQEKPSVKMRINATKLRWNEKTMEVILEVYGHCIHQVNPSNNQILSVYFYKDIDMICKLSDTSYGFTISAGGFNRQHIFYTKNRDEFITSIAKESLNRVGHNLYECKESNNQDYYLEKRMGKYSDDEHITSHAEFTVLKLPVHTQKHQNNPVARLLCITETCLVERDPETYILITLRPLCDIFALIRHPTQPQQFSIEYVHGQTRIYHSTDRDSLLASLLDGVRSSGNRDICVKQQPTQRHLRFGPLIVPLDEETEAQHMRLLQQTPGGMNINEAVARFNANIPYSGLLHAVTQDGLFAENKEKLIKGALTALINREGDQSSISTDDMEAQFHALRRLVASKAGFQGFTNLPGMRETLGRKVVVALRRNNEAVTHAAIDMINALIQPMHENYDIRQEQLNKSSIMASPKFLESLLDMFSLHVLRNTGALVISVMLDFLVFTICPPYCETSEGQYFDVLLKLVSDRGRVMFKLFHHPSMAIVKGAGLIMQALIDEADPEVGDAMQKLSLAEAALPQHLLNACFARNNDHRSLAFRQLNRQLVSLWVTGNPDAKELLKRVLPAGLILYLESTDEPPTKNVDYLFVRDNLEMAQNRLMEINRKNNAPIRVMEKKIDNLLMHWRSKIGIESKPMKDRDEKPVTLRKRRKRIRVLDNWKLFYYHFFENHSLCNLIWNIKTREEFKDALEKEITEFKRERDFCSHIELSEKTDSADGIDENANGDGDGQLQQQQEHESTKKVLVKDLLSQAAKVSWNYVEFKVIYASLVGEIKVGDYYLRLLLEEDERISRLMWERAEKAALEDKRQSLDDTSQEEEPTGEGDMKQQQQSSDPSSSSSSTADNKQNLEIIAGVIKIRQAYEFFHDLYRRFLQYHKVEMRCMCLYAMAIVYARCYREIGTVNDCDRFISLLERTSHKTERDRIILLIEKLILDKRNIELILDAGGYKILIDLVTVAHNHVSRAHAPQQSNVIEAAKDAKSRDEDQYKEWFYQNTQRQKTGPLSLKEMHDLLKSQTIQQDTKVWAQGFDQWRNLNEVPQIKWLWQELFTGVPVLNDSEVSAHILNILVGICRAYPSHDKLNGGIIRPMARIRRQLTQPAYLAHIVQLLLTFDPILVERVAILINLIFDENPYRSRLYITGVFYFILMYTGSNILHISSFLKNNHAVQGIKNEASVSQSSIVANSVLGHILPEAMICFLEHHSAEEFAQIFLGEYDTPESIWNTEMRRFMVEKLACHLMEFSPRLPANNRAIYQYLAIPIVSYPQLDNELFCGSYYLRHLCDTSRFPDWPIRNPVSLLREILQAWKNEVEKKPASMSVKQAYESLGLQYTETAVNDQATRTREESLIRKAYFQLSMKYHPDKNPDGRDMFDKINSAYQFLCNRAKLCSGPDPKNIVLLLRSQSILFQRCRPAIENLKYSGYPMLIKTILAETEDELLFQKETPLLAACAELAYATVAGGGALNAEEFRRQDGIQALQAGFCRCVGVITRASSQQGDFSVRVCGFMCLFVSVSAQFEACRQRIHEIPQIASDLVRLLYFKNLSQLNILVARCIADLSSDVWLQQSLFENGALYHLLSFVFNYDYTLDEGGVAKSEDNHKQEVQNRLAITCMLAIARICGSPNDQSSPIQQDSASNETARSAISAMLTPYIQRKIIEYDKTPTSLKMILKLLNTNCETPYLLWDNRTRSELQKYLSDQQDSLIRTGECDGHYGAEFKFSMYSKELIIGEVFVRIFNEQKGFQLENPRHFTIDLLLYLRNETTKLHESVSVQHLTQPTVYSLDKSMQQTNQNMLAALQSLVIVLGSQPGLAIQLIGHFKMIFCMMTYRLLPAIQEQAVVVVRSISANEECLEDIGASQVIVHLVRLVEILPQSSALLLDCISRMISITSLLKELVYRGCLIYTLWLFTCSPRIEVRTQAAAMLGRMMNDKLVGNRIRAILLQFLPMVFIDAMKDNPDNCIHLYDNSHENPELIWNEETRNCLSQAVTDKKNQFFEEQSRDLNKKWSVPEEYRVSYDSIVNCGPCVAGVYLHLFVANPNWVLRNPDEFTNQLFNKLFETVNFLTSSNTNQNGLPIDSDQLELITDAIARFLDSHSGSLDALPRKGYVHQLFEMMNKHPHNEPIMKAGLLISHQMANSKLCVGTMASIDSIRALLNAMKCRPDQMSLAGETMFRLFQSTGSADDLIGQAIRAKLVEYLLNILDTPVLPGVKDLGQVKAYIVKALKAMQRSPTYGVQISSVLDNSKIWHEFRHQSHDLYIQNNSQISGYLTGGGRSIDTAGYLTSAPATHINKPPPTNSSPTPPPNF